MYLQTFKWHHFVTLTVERSVPVDRLKRMFESDFVRRLSRAAQTRIPFFFAIERGYGSSPLAHLHGLIAGTRELRVDIVRDAWRHGHKCVRIYDPSRGAAIYTAKGLLIDPDGYEFSARLPQRREDAEAVAIRAVLDGTPLASRGR